MSEELNDQLLVRRQKMNDIRESGLDPFGGKYERTHLSKEILDQYDHLPKEELDPQEVHVQIAGRIMAKRSQGKAGFAIFKI